MKIREVQDRTAPLVTALLAVWEKSVRATHTFLSEEEIEHIKTYVPTAFHSVQHLLTAETASGEPVAFMGITGNRLEADHDEEGNPYPLLYLKLPRA